MSAPSELHEALVAQLVRESGGSRRGFRATLRRAMGEEIAADIAFPDSMPDAYVIDRETRVGTVFEVEVAGPLTDVRLRGWARLWFEMDAYDWTLNLTVADRFGEVREVNLPRLWYALHAHELEARIPG